MRLRLRVAWLVFGVAVALSLLPPASRAAEETRLGRNGSLEIANRQVHCANVQTRLDRRLPNLGAASPEERIMILNPTLLGRYSRPVQLFVFHHECGHHQVGASELAADCWAVSEGVRGGWLDRNGLAQVCRSFNNAPETSTHPAGARRCANLDKCFAKAETEQARLLAAKAPATKSLAVKAAVTPPRLLVGPRLVRTGVLR